ncbi:MAG: hypothetical protein P1U63_12815 [Coxiellaceae bacterium]|nr:hypothetical protein [Coxiellaceae bacterium]
MRPTDQQLSTFSAGLLPSLILPQPSIYTQAAHHAPHVTISNDDTLITTQESLRAQALIFAGLLAICSSEHTTSETSLPADGSSKEVMITISRREAHSLSIDPTINAMLAPIIAACNASFYQEVIIHTYADGESSRSSIHEFNPDNGNKRHTCFNLPTGP